MNKKNLNLDLSIKACRANPAIQIMYSQSESMREPISLKTSLPIMPLVSGTASQVLHLHLSYYAAKLFLNQEH